MSQIDKYYLKEGFAGPLLQSAQTLRTHWSSVIVNLLIYTWFTLILLWAYCLTNFISNFNYPEFNYLILIIPSGISCVIISLWRLYTKHLDNAIANLYPGFLVYEMNLGLSFDKELGTFSYLKSEIKNLMMISFDKITFTMSIDIIRKLIENKKIGNRGHKKLDVIACCLIVFFMLLSIIEFWINIEKTQFCILILITLILEFSSLFLFLWTYFCYSQKNPTDDEIKKAIQEVEEKYNTNS